MNNSFYLKLFIPSVTSFLSLTRQNYTMGIVSLIAIIIFVAAERECRGNENFWLYVLFGVSSIPLNIEIAYRISQVINYIIGYSTLYSCLVFVLLMALLFNLEEILIGIVGRVIWKKQKTIKINIFGCGDY